MKPKKQTIMVKLTCDDYVKRGSLRSILSEASKMVNQYHYGHFKFSMLEIPKEERKKINQVVNDSDYDTQNRIILKHLQAGKTITSLESFQMWKITRLSARIYELRWDKKIHIMGELEKNEVTGKRYMRYFLASPEKKK